MASRSRRSKRGRSNATPLRSAARVSRSIAYRFIDNPPPVSVLSSPRRSYSYAKAALLRPRPPRLIMDFVRFGRAFRQPARRRNTDHLYPDVFDVIERDPRTTVRSPNQPRSARGSSCKSKPDSKLAALARGTGAGRRSRKFIPWCR